LHLQGTMIINDKGHLQVGKIDTLDLVREFGTPLWVIDEKGFRENCQKFKNAFQQYGDSLVIYASKSFANLAVYKIIAEEGLGLDVVSGGELYTALKAGFPVDKIFFHGNNKSRAELEMAVNAGISRIVVDNFYELDLLNDVCTELGKRQAIYLRITPGVGAHTHEYIMTGQVDSKFGFTLPDGQALSGVKSALGKNNLDLIGLHCHIGSQIFEMDSYFHTTELMMDFLGQIYKETNYLIDELDVGGGFGIYYASGDKPADPEEWAKAIMKTVQEKSDQIGIKTPKIIVEPGRSIAGPAGITLYTIGSSKQVNNIRKYIAVDGGMTDNPRPALYGAKYEAIIANKAKDSKLEKVSIAGKCCESGDMLIWDIDLPHAEPGDILAVFATGAYTYSMSSNYNRLPRPAVVLVNEGEADVIVKRETYEDIIRNDVIPPRFKG